MVTHMPRKSPSAGGVQQPATTLATVAQGCCNSGPLLRKGGTRVADHTPKDFDGIPISVLRRAIVDYAASTGLPLEVVERFVLEAMATQPTEPGHGRPAQPEVTP